VIVLLTKTENVIALRIPISARKYAHSTKKGNKRKWKDIKRNSEPGSVKNHLVRIDDPKANEKKVKNIDRSAEKGWTVLLVLFYGDGYSWLYNVSHTSCLFHAGLDCDQPA